MVEAYVLAIAIIGVGAWLYWHDKKNDQILEEVRSLLKNKHCDCCKCKGK